MAGNSGGPWGGGGGGGNGRPPQGGGGNRPPNGGRRPEDQQIPEIDELMKKGQEKLRVLMGGKDDGRGRNGGGIGDGGDGPAFTKGTVFLALLGVIALWLYASFYTVRPEERSVELTLGKCNAPCVGQPGLNFAPWPIVTAEVIQVTRENVIEIGEEAVSQQLGRTRADADTGLMLTGDENIVDIDFEVVWNIKEAEPDKFLFNLADPETTIAAVAESVMREIIARSELAPILNRDRGIISEQLLEQTQATLDSYDSGVDIVRINLNAAEPPSTSVSVRNIDGREIQQSPLAAYRDVQDAEQQREQVQNEANAYKNRVEAQSRGNAAQMLEQAYGYQARVVNDATGEASRFTSVLEEYTKAPDVTRQRLYLEMIEEVLGKSDIILLDQNGGQGSGVVPYLPLDQLRRPATGGSN